MSRIDVSDEPYPTSTPRLESVAKELYLVDSERKINVGRILIYPHIGSSDLQDKIAKALAGLGIEV